MADYLVNDKSHKHRSKDRSKDKSKSKGKKRKRSQAEEEEEVEEHNASSSIITTVNNSNNHIPNNNNNNNNDDNDNQTPLINNSFGPTASSSSSSSSSSTKTANTTAPQFQSVAIPHDTPVSIPYTQTTAVRYLSISPAYSINPTLGIRHDHLDPLVFKYDPLLCGVVLAHANLHFLDSTARLMNESPFAFTWVSVEFLLWQPKIGMVLEGWVNNSSPGHVGMLYGNVFSVSVRLGKGVPETWKWVDDAIAEEDEYEQMTDGATTNGVNIKQDEVKEEEEDYDDDDDDNEGNHTKAFWQQKTKTFATKGYWTDESGAKVEGGRKFVVTAVKTDGGMVSLEGSFIATHMQVNNHSAEAEEAVVVGGSNGQESSIQNQSSHRSKKDKKRSDKESGHKKKKDKRLETR